jgi:hypothetical protein
MGESCEVRGFNARQEGIGAGGRAEPKGTTIKVKQKDYPCAKSCGLPFRHPDPTVRAFRY